MVKLSKKAFPLLFMGVLVAMISLGCSGDNPLAPSDGPVTKMEEPTPDPTITAAGFQFASRVASIDLAEQTLTFTDPAYTAVAGEDCVVFTMVTGEEVVISFGDIQVGDSVQVCGVLQEDDVILANRIRVYGGEDCDPYDLAFGGTIATIDYAAGTFTVADRSETIMVDENTVIWTRISETGSLAAGVQDPSRFTVDHGHYKFTRDTILAFTDLAVGDWVEVKANIIDATTLLAVKIKLAPDCLKKCVAFTDYLASADGDTRTVTFENMAWIGSVCANALLADSDGAPLTLADFAPADLVSVKGFALEGDELRICEMVKQ